VVALLSLSLFSKEKKRRVYGSGYSDPWPTVLKTPRMRFLIRNPRFSKLPECVSWSGTHGSQNSQNAFLIRNPRFSKLPECVSWSGTHGSQNITELFNERTLKCQLCASLFQFFSNFKNNLEVIIWNFIYFQKNLEPRIQYPIITSVSFTISFLIYFFWWCGNRKGETKRAQY
jgi:hypothetical protein